MTKQMKIVSTLVLAAVLTGCGQSTVGSADFVLTQRQHLSKAAKVTPKASHISKQESVINIVAPSEHKGSGAIAMNFKFPEKEGYSVMATANDISKITVTLKTRSFLLTKTVATAEVTKAQIVSNKAAVQFTGLAGGNYTVEIAALNAANTNIGSSTETVAVTEGQTSTVNSRLQLVGGGTTPATTALGVNVDIINGL
jgi:hypothetical protein